MRLNGFQRIGVVLSVVWAVGAFLYVRKQQMKFGFDYAKSHFDTCMSHSVVADCVAKMDKELSTAYQIGWEEVTVYALLPIPLVWLVIYIGIKIFKWVRKGFV
jgi:hypothetical protein